MQPVGLVFATSGVGGMKVKDVEETKEEKFLKTGRMLKVTNE